MALLALPVRAEEPPGAAAPDPEEIPTFVYQDPQPGPHRLRAAAELAVFQAIAFTGYLVADPAPSMQSMRDPVPLWDKLTFRGHSWAFEADDIRYNYYAHPLEGALYYLTARGNRLPIMESSLWTAASALAWELVEYHEPVSISDLWTTTFGGLAIGEALTQLSAHLERTGGAAGEVFSWVAIPKRIHDLVDGVRSVPLEDPGWHHIQVFQGGGPLRQGAAGPRTAGQSSFASRLFRLPGYGAPGGGTTAVADAERSRLGLSFTYGSSGLVEARLRTQISAFGLYTRDIALDAGGRPSGADLFVGAKVGFDYQYRDANLPAPLPADTMILVEVPGIEVEARAFSGAFSVEAQASAAVTFGGVRPLGFDRTAPPPEVALPSVMTRQGYYHAAGAALGLDVRLGLGPMSLGAGIAHDGCWAIQQLDGAPAGRKVEIFDSRLETGARAGYRLGGSGVEVVARWDRWARTGVVGGTTQATASTLTQLGLALSL